MEEIQETNKLPNTLSFLFSDKNSLKDPIDIFISIADYLTINKEHIGRIQGFNSINEFFEIYINIYDYNLMGVKKEDITRLFPIIEEIYCKADHYFADTHAVCNWIREKILNGDERYDPTNPKIVTQILTEKFVNMDYDKRIKEFNNYLYENS